MIENNLLIRLLSNGLSWQDSTSAKEQARLLNEGDRTLWKEMVLSSATKLGIPKVLRQIALSSDNIQAWGVYYDAILDLFGIPEIRGLSCDPTDFVDSVAAGNPSSWEEVRKSAISIAGNYLEKQIESGDVYLLRPSDMTSAEFAKYTPSIIDARKKGIEESRPYLHSDGWIDMFDFLELPITLELMLESGVGGRASKKDATVVLERMKSLELISKTKPSEKREVERSAEEKYLTLYQNCTNRHMELLRGVAMSYDPEEKICKRGLELVYNSGHVHTLQPLLYGLEKQNPEIVQLSLTGLGILGDRSVIDKIGEVLKNNPTNEIQTAACAALGKLKAERYINEIANLSSSREESVGLAAMNALLSINTQESMNYFWGQIPRFGMPKLVNISETIAGTKTDEAVIFLMGVLLLDLQAFLYTREVHFYNAFLQAKDEVQQKLMLTVVNLMREHGVSAFGKLGDKAVPVLVSLLKIFQDTGNLFQDIPIWEDSEHELKNKVSSRIGEYFRLPRSDIIPPPVTQTIRALGVTHSTRAIPFLEAICKLENEELVACAMEALSEIDLPALDALLKVKTPSTELKLRKTQELGTIVHPKVTDWLVKQLDDENPFIRLEASTFLAMRNDPALVKHLKRSAEDSNKGVRAGLANVIVRIGIDAYPEIMKILSEDTDDDIRNVIAQAQMAYKADQDDDYWA